MNLLDIKKATAGKFTPQSNIFMELELSKVYPNPDQPRKKFSNLEMIDLAAAIKKDGLLQPIIVARRKDRFMIIGGERRYKAHLLLKASTIKAHIIDADDERILELALIENIQREDLTDFEIAKHIVKLWESGKYALKKDLAQAIAKSQSYISKSLGCMKLNDEILKELEDKKLDVPLSVLEEISRIDEDKQLEVFKKYQGKEITRDGIKKFKSEKKASPEKYKSVEKVKITEGLGGMTFSYESASHFMNRSFIVGKSYKITVEEI